MRALTAVTGRLTYANVAATLALVLALTGTAYAAGLGKNSVGSKQIKNNSVKTVDIRDGSLTGVDVAGNSLGGAQVDEASLGVVPNAGALGGVPSTGYARSTPSVGGNFANGTPLALAVSGYGTYRLLCESSTVAFGYSNNLGSDAAEAVAITAAGGPLVDAVTRIHNEDAGNGGTFTHEGNRIYVDALVRSANGARAIRITLRGWNTATNVCFGFIEGQILR